MAYNHGINVEERATSLTIPAASSSGLQVVIGTAPVNMISNPKINEPVICYSLDEATKALGYCTDFADFTLCESMYANFQLFNVAPIILINVLDPDKHKKSVAETKLTVSGHECKIDEAGVIVSTLVVKAGDLTLQAGTDYVTSFETDGGLLISLAPSSESYNAAEVTVTYDAVDASKVTAEDIVGGVDVATGKRTGIELVRSVFPKFGLVPGLILAPKYSNDATVAAALNAKTTQLNGNFRCEAVIDIDTSKTPTYTDVKAQKEAQGVTGIHEFAMWPKIGVGSYRLDYSAVWAANIAQADADNDNFPVNRVSSNMLSITGAYLEDGTEILLDSEEAAMLNGQGIVTCINEDGWKSYGNNTAAYPSTTDPKDRWINCRRIFSWWANSFIKTYKQKVDDPTNKKLVESVVNSENIRFSSYAPDKVAGGYIEYNESENPITNILNGTVKFNMHLAPYVPAEYIDATLEFDPDILESALEGDSE